MNKSARRVRPGTFNCITDVPGLSVGAAENVDARTGVSVILPDAPAIAAVDVRGGGPGTRETDLLDPSTLVDRVDAIVLSGGSTYGLGAADGVAAKLGAAGRGFRLSTQTGVPPSPIAPAAILYDLANGGDKAWGETPPYPALGAAALEDAMRASGRAARLGSAGAGYGARAGAVRGGLGAASYETDAGLVVGALMAVNSFGSVYLPGCDAFWAWPLEEDGEFGGARPPEDYRARAGLPDDTKLGASAAPVNTTIGVVAVAADLTPSEARRVAIMAQDGLARAIRPVHGPTDGDVVFVIAVGGRPCGNAIALTEIGALAADCVARAIARGVHMARAPFPGS